MDEETKLIARLYEGFNARNIDAVLALLTDDVEWANGMEGGYAHGHEGLRDYWTRQWSMVSPHVEPVGYKAEDGSVVVEVRQSIFDLTGKPLQDETFGLRDKTVEHVFRLRDGLVYRFDIRP